MGLSHRQARRQLWRDLRPQSRSRIAIEDQSRHECVVLERWASLCSANPLSRILVLLYKLNGASVTQWRSMVRYLPGNGTKGWASLYRGARRSLTSRLSSCVQLATERCT